MLIERGNWRERRAEKVIFSICINIILIICIYLQGRRKIAPIEKVVDENLLEKINVLENDYLIRFKSKLLVLAKKKEVKVQIRGGPDPNAFLEGKFNQEIMGDLASGAEAFVKKDVVVDLAAD